MKKFDRNKRLGRISGRRLSCPIVCLENNKHKKSGLPRESPDNEKSSLIIIAKRRESFYSLPTSSGVRTRI
ncbi:hypothetical protein HMPREF7215_1622 [Pyramidobacter piscolens W5455]|uniref:Uncharacterized protein n=1 Tax=Pyramidobacter piscolens W5455 TaxID=352165 RepID=A0ABM9ZW39_9BACT|nr:hypothetical protein HMPREF7215_1622 [Pyramidobacter piscolens W5455]